MKKRYIFLICLPLVFCGALFLLIVITGQFRGMQDLMTLLDYAVPLAIIGYIIGAVIDYIVHKKEVVSGNQTESVKKSGMRWTIILGSCGLIGSIIFSLPSYFGPNGPDSLAWLSIFVIIIVTLVGTVIGFVIDSARHFSK